LYTRLAAASDKVYQLFAHGRCKTKTKSPPQKNQKYKQKTKNHYNKLTEQRSKHYKYDWLIDLL
jgi:hypothetical protein